MYEEKDNQYYMGLGRMKSKKYIAWCPTTTAWRRNTGFWKRRIRRVNSSFFCPAKRTRIRPSAPGNDVLRPHQLESRHFRLMEVKENKTNDRSAWKEVIPHRPHVYLQQLDAFKNYLVLGERQAGLIHLRVLDQEK
jgi:oligopeptidase B